MAGKKYYGNKHKSFKDGRQTLHLISTLTHRTLFQKFWKKDRYFRCIGLLRSSKLVHLDAKK